MDYKFVFYVVLEDGITENGGRVFFANTRAEARSWIDENDDPQAGAFKIRRAKAVLFNS